MNKRAKGVYMVLVGSVFLGSGLISVAQAETTMTHDQVVSLMSDKTYDYQNSKGMKMRIYTDAEGNQHIHFLTGKKAGKKRHDRWAVEDGQRCIYRARKDNKRFCADVVDMGDGTYRTVREGRFGVISNAVDGNQL